MIISPSVLSANFLYLGDEIKSIEESGATWLHYDVMDAHFVPNISFGYSILGNIKKSNTPLVLDVHLMMSDPLSYIDNFIKNGADYVTFHYEAYDSKEMVQKTIEAIKTKGCKVGLSIKPGTSVDDILEYLPILDLVLVMSVEPGFGGQSFMENSLAKIAMLRKEIDDRHLNCLIEVDGGINDTTSKLVKEAGCDVVVAGSYFFNFERNERYKAVELLK